MVDVIDFLRRRLKGTVFNDLTHKAMYATDASAYREIPFAIAFPADEQDLQEILLWAAENSMPVIPRTAGTSLAGQVVGNGLVVDTGRNLNRILEVNPEEKYAWVQPGVIRDDLNRKLKQYGLFFAPETSTSNRCMIGGMVGNNACGANSLVYGSTRDHLLEVKGFWADGSPLHAKPLSIKEFNQRLEMQTVQGDVFRFLNRILGDENNRERIIQAFPPPEIKRRNTGYALDISMDCQQWVDNDRPFNLAPLIAGSEGTLVMMSAIKVNLVELPPEKKVIICAQFKNLEEVFDANLIVLKYPVRSIELIDNIVLECTELHQSLKTNRFFIEGNPAAVLFIELAGDNLKIIEDLASEISEAIYGAGYGYAFPIVKGSDIDRVWELRKAGLGLLSNVKGPARPVPFIEDAAVRPQELKSYVVEIREMLASYGLSCVFYAHIGTGELHLRPVLDLKNPDHIQLFRRVAEKCAGIVKKYNGSLSGEHGDGRSRGEFVKQMVGEEVYTIFNELKYTFDPKGLLNPGKIVDAVPMDTSLRYPEEYYSGDFTTAFDFSADGGLLQAVERCNGSGDCLKPHWYGGEMCPSYQVTRDERLSTRGRANFIRESLAFCTEGKLSVNLELIDVLNQCLSCKACKNECPSSVDLARYKAEILNLYYQHHSTPLPVKLMMNIFTLAKLFKHAPWLFNAAANAPLISRVVKRAADIHPQRSLPRFPIPSLSVWVKRNKKLLNPSSEKTKGHVLFYVDEFTDYLDPQPGIAAISLLAELGYRVSPFCGKESGRVAVSKGKLDVAKRLASDNVMKLKSIVRHDKPLVGVEPSALLIFKDEYPDLVTPELVEGARQIAAHTLLIEDFIVSQFDEGKITSEVFEDSPQKVVFHGHCHQKAISNTGALKRMLEIPIGYKAEEIKSGCCGMAGSFGMERKNYDLSMKIGEQVLFPYLRNLSNGTIVAMPGTSCRQQVFDGTGIRALHPVEILFRALVKRGNT